MAAQFPNLFGSAANDVAPDEPVNGWTRCPP